jgi:hypothetical protein
MYDISNYQLSNMNALPYWGNWIWRWNSIRTF